MKRLFIAMTIVLFSLLKLLNSMITLLENQFYLCFNQPPLYMSV